MMCGKTKEVVRTTCRALVIVIALMSASPAGSEAAGLELSESMVRAAEPVRSVEIIRSEGGDMAVVAAKFGGGPLPGENTASVTVPVPPASRVFASRLLGADRHWTVPVWTASIGAIPALTQYALWRTDGGGYGAAIGLVDKYLAVGTVRSVEINGSHVKVVLAEPGRALFYVPGPPNRVLVNDEVLELSKRKYEDRWLALEMPWRQGITTETVVEMTFSTP